MNSIFYVVTGMVFYALLRRLTRSPEVSFVATLFLVTNYAAVTGGLAYLMDMSGWMFYIISLYCALRYMQTGREKWLYFSAAAIGVGGVFKEYALLGYIVLAGSILFLHWGQWMRLVRKLFVSGLIAAYLCHDEYLFTVRIRLYVFQLARLSGEVRLPEQALGIHKSFGSLFNFGWLFFSLACTRFLKRAENRSGKNPCSCG